MQSMWRIAIAWLAVVVFSLAALEARSSSSTLSRLFTVDIPSEKVAAALIDLAHQAGIQVLMPGELTDLAQSRAVSGRMSVQEALAWILQGTNLRFEELGENTIGIERAAPQASLPADFSRVDLPNEVRWQPVHWTQSSAESAEVGVDEQQGPAPSTPQPATQLENIIVTGSRIPRLTALDVGPAPVVTITGADILQKGFTDMSDVMRNLNQNLGSLDNNTATDGFSPGAQAVDLRGMGPNHTLVLVNGRRIADYPQAYGGNSNFTDISNIPTTMIDHIDVLSGSDSAVYGSDAIAGVINFILKKKADGTTVDYREGETEHGGGSSQRLTLTSGFSNQRFDSIFYRATAQPTAGVGVPAQLHRLDARCPWGSFRQLRRRGVRAL